MLKVSRTNTKNVEIEVVTSQSVKRGKWSKKIREQTSKERQSIQKKVKKRRKMSCVSKWRN